MGYRRLAEEPDVAYQTPINHQEALEQIEGILAERLAVAVGFRAGRGAVSTLIAVGSEPEFLSDDIDRVTLYSWRGTHDSSVPA